MFRFLVPMLLALTVFTGTTHAAPPPVAAFVPLMSMGGHSFDGARIIEEYADRIAPNDPFKRVQIILTLQARFFLEKAREELDDAEAIRYSDVLEAMDEHPLEWPEFAQIPEYPVKSPLGADMIALLEQDRAILPFSAPDKEFDRKAKDLYLNVRNFAYSMGYVRLFDNYFEYPGNPLISREARDTLPENGAALENKQMQNSLDGKVWNWFYMSMGFVVFMILLIAALPLVLPYLSEKLGGKRKVHA